MKTAVALLISIALIGCAAVPSDYANTDEMTLCVSYLTLPSNNIHHPARAAAISSRGINCNKYIEVARLRLEQERLKSEAFENVLNRMSAGSTVPGQPGATKCIYKSQSVSGFNKICIYNCMGSDHAVNMRALDICPLNVTK